MPVHDWTRVSAGTFHHFHTAWITALSKTLNGGLLPRGFYALSEQVTGEVVPDVVALHAGEPYATSNGSLAGATAVLEAPPQVAVVHELTEEEAYAVQQNSLVIRHASGDRIVALIEILSPGNKSSIGQLESLTRKLSSAIHHGFHLLVIDLLPPGPYDPQGIHAAFWHFGQGAQFKLPSDKRRTLVAYEASPRPRAYVEPIGLDQILPPMPLFLEPGWYVNVPLEPSYAEAYAAVPERWRSVIEG
ncbi:MAG: DUF4058 family protein [Pirellulales bacterium]